MKTNLDYLEDHLARNGPDEWRRVASRYNWDLGLRPLRWIIEQGACDKGTAQTIFWNAEPEDVLKFRSYAAAEAARYVALESFRLADTIVRNWNAGLYRTARFTVLDQYQYRAPAYRKTESEIGVENLPWRAPDDLLSYINGEDVGGEDDAEGYPPELIRLFERIGLPH